MPYAVLLDSAPLGLLVHGRSDEGHQARQWIYHLLDKGHQLYIPEIVDYELRRELVRIQSPSLAYLNALPQIPGFTYLSVTKRVFHRAAQLWANSRNQGHVTADKHALDIDVLLAATALLLPARGYEKVIATTNVKHLHALAPALHWEVIR